MEAHSQSENTPPQHHDPLQLAAATAAHQEGAAQHDHAQSGEAQRQGVSRPGLGQAALLVGSTALDGHDDLLVVRLLHRVNHGGRGR